MKVDPRSFKGLSRFLAPSAGGPVADRALAERLITPEQLHECVTEQDRSGRPLDEILVERGLLKAEEVTRLRAPALPPEVVAVQADPARRLGHYILVSLLGTGGMAEVWKAWDGSLGRWVAVKYLKQEIGHPTQRIEREGRMAGQLSHPSIISIFERGQHEGRPYLVMPFVDGTTPRAPLPAREAARLTLEVARALGHAHEMGVIHRDVKPANILVEAGGRVVLADFGLAILDDTATSRWALSGTPEYASPEQIRGDALDARTDVYSLGATLYHLLSGRPPFTGSGPDDISTRVLNEDPPPLRSVPGALEAAVRRAMTRDREKRYASMSGFCADLEAFLDRHRHGLRLRPSWIAIALLSALLPWGVTLAILSQLQKQGDSRLILQALREGDREVAAAERRRSDPGASDAEAIVAARNGLTQYNLALRWAEGNDPEASLGIARCHELMGDDVTAERFYKEALPLPAAEAGLSRVWARILLEGRQDRDWRSGILRGRLPADPARLLAEQKWEPLLALRPRDRDDDGLALMQGAAAIELQRWDDALRRLNDGLRLRPRDATLLHYKGRALAGKGDREGAAAAWTEALKHEPGGWTLHAETERRRASLGK